MQRRRLAGQELTRADHAHHDPLGVVVERRGEQDDRRAEEDTEPEAAELPAGEAEEQAERDDDEPGLEDVPEDEKSPAHGAALLRVVALVRAVVLGESARRPIRLRRVATARTVE